MDPNNSDKSGHQIEIPKKARERPEKMFYLGRINDYKILIVRIGIEMFTVDHVTFQTQFCIDHIFVYDASANVLQEISKVWDDVSNGKHISVTLNVASNNKEEKDEERDQDDNEYVEDVDLNVERIYFAEDDFGFEFRDKFDYMSKLTTYDLGESAHLLVLQSFTKFKLDVARVIKDPYGRDRCESYAFKRTTFTPTFSDKLLILSAPTRITIYANRDIENFQVDFNYTKNPTLSLSFFSKKKITIFLIDLVTLQLTKTSIQVPKFQSYSNRFTMFSPNGNFFLVHTCNPNIYLRESNTWISVADNISEHDTNFTCRIDLENRFLAFSRKNYIAVCNLRTGIIFQKISRLMVGTASFSFFKDKYRQLCLIYQNGSAIESTQVVENVNRLHEGDVSYDVIHVSQDGKKLVASFKTEDNDTANYDLMQVFDVESSSVHTKRDFMFQTFVYSIGQHSIGFYNDMLFVDDFEHIRIWKLAKNSKPIPSPDYLKPNEIFFLDKIKRLIYIDGEFLRCCEVNEDNAGGVQLQIKESIPVSESVVNSISECAPYLDMNNANLVHFQGVTPQAVLDLANKTIKTVEFRKNDNFVPDSTKMCRKFCFDLILGEMDEPFHDSVILEQRKSLNKLNPISYDWSYDEKVIAVAWETNSNIRYGFRNTIPISRFL